MISQDKCYILEVVLNELLLPQCKDIIKFECELHTYDGCKLWILMIRNDKGFLSDGEYWLFRTYIKMLDIEFEEYVLDYKIRL